MMLLKVVQDAIKERYMYNNYQS